MGRKGQGGGHGRAQGKRNQGIGGGSATSKRVLPELRGLSQRRDSGLPTLGRFSGKMEKLLRKQKARQNLTILEERRRGEEAGAEEPTGKRRRTAAASGAVPAAQLAALVLDAARQGNEFDTRQKFLAEQRSTDAGVNRTKEISRRRFWKEFQKVVQLSDVLLEVLDARDPVGCRLKDIERAIGSQYGSRKQFCLVLNKVDLVPRENAEQWLEYFRQEGIPVVAFSAAGGGKAAAHETSSSKEKEDPARRCVDHMFEVLRRFQRTEGGGRRKITVGVVGYPNVGKSSIINALKRQRVVGVGNTAGFTTSAQEVHLQQHVKVVDCPGVVMGDSEDADVVLRNAMKIEHVTDPVRPCELIWDRCGAARLAHAYQLPEPGSFDQLIRELAHKTGRLRKGGEANTEDVCRQLLRDWNDGRIPFYTVPPLLDTGAAPATLPASAQTAAERDQETTILTSFAAAPSAGFICLQPGREQKVTYGVDDERLQRRGLKRKQDDDEVDVAGGGDESDAGSSAVAEEYDDRDELRQLADDAAAAAREERAEAMQRRRERLNAAAARRAKEAGGDEMDDDGGGDDDDGGGGGARAGGGGKKGGARSVAARRILLRKKQKERRVLRAKQKKKSAKR